MKNKKQLTLIQREKALIELIKDARIMSFNNKLIKRYEKQLNEVQKEIKADKEKIKQFRIDLLRERNLEKVGDTKPLLISEKAVSVALNS